MEINRKLKIAFGYFGALSKAKNEISLFFRKFDILQFLNTRIQGISREHHQDQRESHQQVVHGRLYRYVYPIIIILMFEFPYIMIFDT